jgi:pyruvate formate lyase activating enzyme
MKAYISGFQDMSTLDYPGEVAALIFLAGCNLRCRYCFNSRFLTFKRGFLKNTDYAKNEVTKNLQLLDAIVLSGGEPLLQEKPLIEICKWAQSHKLKTGIETNGTQPIVLGRLLDLGLLDFVAIDIKAPFYRYHEVTRVDNNSIIANIQRSIKILKQSSIELEFRTTFVPGLVGITDIEGMSSLVDQKRWVWQKFRDDLGEVLDKKLVGRSFSSDELEEFEYLSKRFTNVVLRF